MLGTKEFSTRVHWLVSVDKSFPDLRNVTKHVQSDGHAGLGLHGSCLMHRRICTKRHGCKQLKRYVMSFRFALLGRVVFCQRRYFLDFGFITRRRQQLRLYTFKY